ncbi:MAG: class I adenylate-forming enzyme family protein [Bacillota bacterium]|nr:class I adenylate-forming enzyme family protein [Bacillota bacterium]
MTQPVNMRKPSEEKPWLSLYKNIPDINEINKTLNDYVWDRADAYANAGDIALDFSDTKISFAEVKENIEKAAKSLVALGVKKGDIVIICSITTPEMVYLFYALNKIGAGINMVDPRTSAEGIHEYIEEVDAQFIVTLDIFYERVSEAAKNTNAKILLSVNPAESLPKVKQFAFKLVSLSGKEKVVYSDKVLSWKTFIAKGEGYTGPIEENKDPEATAFIFHTGGTTGSPKCVMLSSRALNAVVLQTEINGPKYKDVFLNVMPSFIAYGFGLGIHMPLSVGMTSVIIPNIEPEMMAGLIRKYKPNHMAGVPLHYVTLMNDQKMNGVDLSYICSTGCGGDSINETDEVLVNEFLKKHNAPYPLNKGYGLTEVSSAATQNVGNNNKLGSVGYPLCHTTVSIFEPGTDHELTYGEEGEICITGPTLMNGYYKKPDETADAVRKHSDGQMWLHSGDIGIIDEDGFVYIKSRIKRVVVRHDGFKVYASTIENTASKDKDVLACAAVGIKDKNRAHGNLPVLFIVKREDSSTSDDEFRKNVKALCDKMLPEYVAPVAYYVVPQLPYTGIGKVDFKTLEGMAGVIGY